MITSKTFNLLLSVVFVSSLVFSCKTTRTPRIATIKTGGSDATKVIRDDDDDNERKIVQFYFHKSDLEKLHKTAVESGYRYSVSSPSSHCTDIDETSSKFEEDGDRLWLDDLFLEFPCSYEFNIILLKKEGSNVTQKAATLPTIKMTVSDSTKSPIKKELNIKEKDSTNPGTDTPPVTTPSTDGSIGIKIVPVIVD